MIPTFIYREGAPLGVLPPGVHFASLEEIEKRFATNERRRSLFKGITEVAETLRRAGCRVMFLDGSFVTDKELPEDFDGCWDAHGVNATALDPVLLDFEDSRARQKEKFGGEMFVANWPATAPGDRSEEHTSELQSLMRISYAVFCF